jgi:hypothetical protein
MGMLHFYAARSVAMIFLLAASLLISNSVWHDQRTVWVGLVGSVVFFGHFGHLVWVDIEQRKLEKERLEYLAGMLHLHRAELADPKFPVRTLLTTFRAITPEQQRLFATGGLHSDDHEKISDDLPANANERPGP